jgi:hypothetical protein
MNFGLMLVSYISIVPKNKKKSRQNNINKISYFLTILIKKSVNLIISLILIDSLLV